MTKHLTNEDLRLTRPDRINGLFENPRAWTCYLCSKKFPRPVKCWLKKDGEDESICYSCASLVGLAFSPKSKLN